MPTEIEAQPTQAAPPKLHWSLVLILTWVTNGLFGGVWLMVQADWVRKLRGTKIAWWLALAHTAAISMQIFCEIAAWRGWRVESFSDYVNGIWLVLWVATVYTIRYELLREPIGMVWMSPYLPSILGPVYFQYRLQDYAPAVDGRRATGSLLGL